ncbi:MAG: response regulator [Phycisphaerales bacterium]
MNHRPTHFLLVEDDSSHAELVRIAMEENAVANTMDHVEDGVEAVKYLNLEEPYAASRRPDVVLLDIRLPRMDGHELLEYMKTSEQFATIPVVMLTTSDADSDRARAYKHNANSYVTKPVDFDQFRKMVRDLQLYWAVWNHPPAEMA